MMAELLWQCTNGSTGYGCALCKTPLIGGYVPEMEYTHGNPKLRFVCECGYKKMRYGQINQWPIKLVIRG